MSPINVYSSEKKFFCWNIQFNTERIIHWKVYSKWILTCLNLADNQIHAEGGKYLGRALRRNESLIELNLRLNRLHLYDSKCYKILCFH